MVQFLSIIFFSWISSIFGVFQKFPFFFVSPYTSKKFNTEVGTSGNDTQKRCTNYYNSSVTVLAILTLHALQHLKQSRYLKLILESWYCRSMLHQLPFMWWVIRKQSICNNRAVKKVCFIDATRQRNNVKMWL